MGSHSTASHLAARLKRAGLLLPALVPMLLTLPAAPASAAEITLPPVSLGAGARSSFNNVNVDNSSDDVNDFRLESVRIYITGNATDKIKLTVNTEYTGDPGSGGDDKLIIMDAIGRFEYSPEFNVWAGRFLPPSDRANLYGPYYANHWGVYRDAVQDGYANTAVGRDNGVAYWGDFDNLKISAGLFDVPTTSVGSDNADKVIAAGRIQYDFWDKESGYFLNSTYYGDKDLLAIGLAGQTTSGDTSFSVDLLVEKKLGDGGVITFESEYASYEGLTGSGLNEDGDALKSDGAYGLLSYLFPQPIGIGKIQLLGKYAEASFDSPGTDPKLKTTEANIGYIVKAFNVRGYLFYIDQHFVDSGASDVTSIGVGLQVQM